MVSEVGWLAQILTKAKVEILLLDKKTNFSMWQVKMRAILAQMELEDFLFEEMPRRWTE